MTGEARTTRLLRGSYPFNGWGQPHPNPRGERMELTIEERKRRQYELIMDDCKPFAVMSLSDEELVRITDKNRQFTEKEYRKCK